MRNAVSPENGTVTDSVPAPIRNQVFQIGVDDSAPEMIQESSRKEKKRESGFSMCKLVTTMAAPAVYFGAATVNVIIGMHLPLIASLFIMGCINFTVSLYTTLAMRLVGELCNCSTKK